jgi:hypothetical protein
VILDIWLVSASWLHSCLPCGAFVFLGIHGSWNVKEGDHIHIGQGWRHWAMTKEESIDAIWPKMAGAIIRFSFFGVSAKDNSKHWAMRRLSQLLVLALLSASILLYQFLQPAIGGKGQFLKVSCHRGGPDKATLKGILLDSAAMNSRGSEVPTGLRKYDVELTSVWIKSSVESSYQEKTEGEIWDGSWENNAE